MSNSCHYKISVTSIVKILQLHLSLSHNMCVSDQEKHVTTLICLLPRQHGVALGCIFRKGFSRVYGSLHQGPLCNSVEKHLDCTLSRLRP